MISPFQRMQLDAANDYFTVKYLFASTYKTRGEKMIEAACCGMLFKDMVEVGMFTQKRILKQKYPHP